MADIPGSHGGQQQEQDDCHPEVESLHRLDNPLEKSKINGFKFCGDRFNTGGLEVRDATKNIGYVSGKGGIVAKI